jgi:predicted nuclease of restriction endonuclease-like RecB superfamily
MKLKRSGRTDMVVAVSADLNVGEEDFKDVPGSVFFFKKRINPKDVLVRLEQVGQDARLES